MGQTLAITALSLISRGFLLAAALTGWPLSVEGVAVYNIYDIPDYELAAVDIHDGSYLDWERVIGDPSLYGTDFSFFSGPSPAATYDPSDLDFRIWLGWSLSTHRLYVAMERWDDINTSGMVGVDAESALNYDSVEFMVDGDNGGGEYGSQHPDPQVAQRYVATIHADGEAYLGYLGGDSQWPVRPPYGDVGGRIDTINVDHGNGRVPVVRTIIEFYVTPLDCMNKDSPEGVLVSLLGGGKNIGIDMVVHDYDAPDSARFSCSLSRSLLAGHLADVFVDGHLIGLSSCCVDPCPEPCPCSPY